MKTITSIAEFRKQLADWRQCGDRVAFVPTMGNLHIGHLQLLTHARRLARRTVVSIFVNPLQFGPSEDYQSYPRSLEADSVQLTAEGQRLALLTIRKHRLWEVFLVQQLGFSWDEVHEVAEELEHVQSPLLTRRLDAFLGHPALDPHGDPIPAEDGAIRRPAHRLLADLCQGESGTLAAVKNTSAPFLQYLDKVGLQLGALVEVLDKVAFDNSFELRINRDRTALISAEVSRNLFVTE